MSIIIRSGGQKDQQDKRKQLYTWVGCGLVIVLTLISVVSNTGSEKKPDYSKFSSSRMQDLAALPFGTDAEAGSFLRSNPEYAEISNADLLDSLFSSEDRKERQAQDRAEGTPPPPDPEYREIAKQKEKAEETRKIQEARIERQQRERERYNQGKERIRNRNTSQTQQVRNQNTKTKLQTLGSGGRTSGSSGGASSGVTGSTWRYEGKDIKGSPSSNIGGRATTAQDIAFARERGRNAGLDVALIESTKAANAETAEGAAEGAIDAFQGGVTPEDLEEDEQELGLDNEPLSLNEDLQNDLKRELGDDIDKQVSNSNKSSGTAKGKEYSINENCMDTNGKIDRACRLSKFYDKLIEFGFKIGEAAFNHFVLGA